jgi:hypothetical protein
VPSPQASPCSGFAPAQPGPRIVSSLQSNDLQEHPGYLAKTYHDVGNRVLYHME